MRFDTPWDLYPDWEPCGKCGIAAAILGAGALSAGASIFGASKAADAQTKAAQAAIAAQREMFGITKEGLDPFIKWGQGGIGDLSKFLNYDDPNSPLGQLMRLVRPGTDMSEVLAQTPGYQFTQTQGMKAVTNALAARGLGGSGGAVAKGAGNFVTGLAGNTWQNVVSALQNAASSTGGMLQNRVNTGASAAASLGGNATQVGGQIGSAMIGSGNAQAGMWNSIGGALGGLGSSLSTAAILQRMLGGGSGGSGGGGGLYTMEPAPWAGGQQVPMFPG